MSVEHGQNPNEMREVWSWALSWMLRPSSLPELRAKQQKLIEAIHTKLAEVESPEVLQHLYLHDSGWEFTIIAKNLYPTDWAILGIHATTAAAFGLRYVELQTGKKLDATKELPRWLGEWAAW